MPDSQCFYCGHTGDDVHRHGTHHLGGHGEVPHVACDNEAKCMKNVHNNVRYGRESWDAGKEAKVAVTK